MKSRIFCTSHNLLAKSINQVIYFPTVSLFLWNFECSKWENIFVKFLSSFSTAVSWANHKLMTASRNNFLEGGFTFQWGNFILSLCVYVRGGGGERREGGSAPWGWHQLWWGVSKKIMWHGMGVVHPPLWEPWWSLIQKFWVLRNLTLLITFLHFIHHYLKKDFEPFSYNIRIIFAKENHPRI